MARLVRRTNAPYPKFHPHSSSPHVLRSTYHHLRIFFQSHLFSFHPNLEENKTCLRYLHHIPSPNILVQAFPRNHNNHVVRRAHATVLASSILEKDRKGLPIGRSRPDRRYYNTRREDSLERRKKILCCNHCCPRETAVADNTAGSFRARSAWMDTYFHRCRHIVRSPSFLVELIGMRWIRARSRGIGSLRRLAAWHSFPMVCTSERCAMHHSIRRS
mmetsp:Transcript_2979/g.6237  ORF Transcript_2979/g.6237 Transcript_2979/m.6237 type:complete len:217 (+) Transcript_2979:446-1096(+)